MNVDKLSVSFAPDLGDAVRDAARHSGSSLSGWLAEAAAAKLRTQALDEYLDGWEKEHGKLTPDELAKAAAYLQLPSITAAARKRTTPLADKGRPPAPVPGETRKRAGPVTPRRCSRDASLFGALVIGGPFLG